MCERSAVSEGELTEEGVITPQKPNKKKNRVGNKMRMGQRSRTRESRNEPHQSLEGSTTSGWESGGFTVAKENRGGKGGGMGGRKGNWEGVFSSKPRPGERTICQFLGRRLKATS